MVTSKPIYKSPSQPFVVETFDLTTAREDKPFTIPGGTRFIQATCDGGYEGITIKLGSQSNYPWRLDLFTTMPTAPATVIYLTNDVRSGRSKLTLFYHFVMPGERAHGGENISREELAARLGSIHTFDRRGEVVFQDDFESGVVHFSQSISGLGNISITNAYAHGGALSAKIVTGATTNNYSRMTKQLPYPTLTKVGFECRFIPLNGDGALDFMIKYQKPGTSLRYDATVRYNNNDGTLSIYNSSGGYTDLATSLNFAITDFSVIKLVMDPTNNKYDRLMLNNNDYSLSQYDIYSGNSVASESFKIEVQATTLANVSIKAYIDDVIATKNEP